MKKCSLKVPAKFGMKNYLDKLAYLNDKYQENNIIIDEVYGCIPSSIIGNARAATELEQVDKEMMKSFIAKADSLGIAFDYTLNSFWSNGLEFDSDGRKAILNEIEGLMEIGVRNVTVSSPGILQLLSHHYKDLNITVSINNCVDSLHAIKRWEREGVNKIVLNRHINREFELLKSISKQSNVKLELLVNSLCNLHCALHQYHNMINGCNSNVNCQRIDSAYPQNQCAFNMLSNMTELICSGWIRPEDIHIYEDMGYKYFKLDGRCLPAEEILSTSEAFLARKYEGNFFDLFDNFNQHQDLPFWLELDNRILDGFIERMMNQKARCRLCGGNRQECKRIAESIVVHNLKEMQIYRKILKNSLNGRNV